MSPIPRHANQNQNPVVSWRFRAGRCRWIPAPTAARCHPAGRSPLTAGELDRRAESSCETTSPWPRALAILPGRLVCLGLS
jgi:hypothetical protein